MLTWRIVKASRAKEAFTGEGAREFGGRWNSPGTAVVYTAGSSAGALLEMLVHLGDYAVLPSYVLFACEFDERIVELLDVSLLPADWHSFPAPAALQFIGDRWAQSGSSAVLRVPSALAADEWVYLLNPAHPQFAEIVISSERPVSVDDRLLRR